MKKVLLLLIIASIAGNIAGGLYEPVHAIFVQDIGGSILSVGWASSVYFFIVGICIYFFGKLSDKLGKKTLLLSGFIVLLLGDLYFIFVQNVPMLFIGQIILGLGLAMTNPSWNGLFSMLLDKGKEGSLWDLWEFLVSVSIGVAAIVGAFIVSSFGFSYLFLSKALLHSVSLFCCTRLKEL